MKRSELKEIIKETLKIKTNEGKSKIPSIKELRYMLEDDGLIADLVSDPGEEGNLSDSAKKFINAVLERQEENPMTLDEFYAFCDGLSYGIQHY